MASSRKSKPNPKLANKAAKTIGLALSGGLDSVVLLDTVCKAVQASPSNEPVDIWVFHIHHGLQKPADQWLEFCEKLAKKYQVNFDFRLLHFADQSQGNIEARARAERYEALTDLCIEHGVEDLLLAHHQNDQAETVLLQLLRGSGVAGLSGMPMQKVNALGSPITIWRPLLSQSRAELEAYAKMHKLKWVEDPSNQNTRYRRNAIRKEIIPRLEKIQPGAIANLARSADIFAQSQGLLDRLARLDGKDILQGKNIQLLPMLALAKADRAAANNLLRYWLKLNGLAMPSQERLESWWKDLFSVKADSGLEWRHDELSIFLWRGILQVSNSKMGQWVFQDVSPRSKLLGLPADWVHQAKAQGLIEERLRQGSEKIQIKPNTPRKTLKNLFQEFDIPPWERRAPLLYIDDQLVAVAGVGLSYPHLAPTGKRVLPVWLEKP